MIKALVDRLERISAKAWRWTFVVYYLALSAGTHWPGLRLGPPTVIPVDKILHMTAFCGAVGFLMLTRWCDRKSPRAFMPRNIWRCAGVGIVLAGLDELSQNLPGQDRFATWEDFAANVLGIAIATLVALTLFRRASTPP